LSQFRADLLDRLIAAGRAVAPDTTDPFPMPPVVGDPTIDVAAELAASRDESLGVYPT